MRLVIATCTVDYVGRLSAHLPRATRLILVKADGSVSIHADDRAYKPLNWMTPPCTLVEKDCTQICTENDATDPAKAEKDDPNAVWCVTNPKGEILTITLHEIVSDQSFELGVDPGLEKDGVEAHLQELLAANISELGEGYSLVRREYPTAIGPVDIMAKSPEADSVAVEVKRVGGIDGVEQLTRYLELLNRDPLIAPVYGVFAAQTIKPQARVLAEDRGIRCVLLDYDGLRGIESDEFTLF